MMKLLIALALLAQTISTPTLAYNKDTKQFNLSFAKGSEWVAIHYKAVTPVKNRDGSLDKDYMFTFSGETDPVWTDLHRGWTNVNCYADDRDQDNCYKGSDWDVWFEAQYPKAPNAQGAIEFTDVESNHIVVKAQ